MNTAADSLEALLQAYEAERRRQGFGASEIPVSIAQRLDAERAISALNAQARPGDAAASRDLYFRYLAPILAESVPAREALRTAIASLRPPPPPECLFKKIVRAVVAGHRFQLSIVVACVLAITVTGLISGPPLWRWLNWNVVQISPRPNDVPPGQVQPGPLPTRLPVEIWPRDLRERAQDVVRHALSISLIAISQAEEEGRASLTPRELAAHQVASRRWGALAPAPGVNAMLAAMVAAWPHHPDLPLRRDAAGLATLRRHAGEAAALNTGLPSAALAPFAIGLDGVELPKEAQGMLARFVRSQPDAPSTPLPQENERSRVQWTLAVFALPPLLTALWGFATFRRRWARLADDALIAVEPAARAAAENKLRQELAREETAVFKRELGKRERPGVLLSSRPFMTTFGRPPPVPRAHLKAIARTSLLAGRRLDDRRSVAAVVRGEGYARPVFRKIRRLASYLVLLRRASEDDHERARIRRFLDEMRATGFPVDVYEYRQSPERLIDFTGTRIRLAPESFETWAEQREIGIATLADRHPQARLLIISDGRELIEPIRMAVRPAIAGMLSPWPNRMLLTPVPPGDWGIIEYVLSRDLRLGIGRATEGALSDLANGFDERATQPAFARALSQAGARRTRRDRVLAWLDATLDTAEAQRRFGPGRYLSRGLELGFDNSDIVGDIAPDDESIRDLIEELGDWLDEDGYRWHAALALYPEIQLDLTLHVGGELRTLGGDGRPVFKPGDPAGEKRFERMGALPWFRSGRWPLWLRKPLFDTLDQADQIAARQIIMGLFTLANDAPTPAQVDTNRLRVWWPRTGGLERPHDPVSVALRAEDRPKLDPKRFQILLQNELEQRSTALAAAHARLVALRRVGLVVALSVWSLALLYVWPQPLGPDWEPRDWETIMVYLAGMALTAIGAALWGIIARLRGARGGKGGENGEPRFRSS